MQKSEIFFRESIKRIFSQNKSVVDIGGGLRISKERGNRYSSTLEWIIPLVKSVQYQILDPVDTYNPDIIGDIHQLPFKDNSQEAIICMSVLEHVENPILACQEIYRVLKPHGMAFVYVPFLYYYHAEKGYYHDYWRFTEDTVAMLFKNFTVIEICRGRGAIETVFHLFPFGKNKFIVFMGKLLDKVFGKSDSKQTSGYNIFLQK